MFIVSWLLVTFLLLLGVLAPALFAFGLDWLFSELKLATPFQQHQISYGVIGEALRAAILCYIYPQLRGASSTLWHAIKFGLLMSALIGSIWLIVGASLIGGEHAARFILTDSLVLFAQGLLSGLGLYAAHRYIQRIKPD